MADESRPLLLQERPKPGVFLLRMNRPTAYNALSVELVVAMRAAVAQLWAEGARVMVLAASQPGFCAGADLKQRKAMTHEQKYQHNRAINALANEIAACPIPTIAAINGLALGGGCELSLACDLRYASSDAKIGLTEARVGAIPGAGGSQRLPRLLGTARALELMFTGEPVDAARAASIGLVNDVFAGDKLEPKVLALAELIATRSRSAARHLKSVVYGGIHLELQAGLELERAAVAEILASDDYKEGLAAFAERRPAKFS
jgi:enoyl-CoA hydratase/carnithine racemase